MATAVNDITGALITTKGKSTTNYADNYDRIFRNKAEPKPETPTVTLKGSQHTVKLPVELVTQLGWVKGDTLEVTVRDGKLVLSRQ